MATHKLFIIKSYFNYVYESFPANYVKQTTMKACWFLWVLVCNFVVSSFWHFVEYLAGSRIDDDHDKILEKSLIFDEQKEGFLRNSSNFDYSKSDIVDEDEKSARIFDFVEEEVKEEEEEEKSELIFGFPFQKKEEDLISYKEDATINAKTGDVFKYQFVSVKDIDKFVAEPESGSFTVHKLLMKDGLKEDDFMIKGKEVSRNLDHVEVKQEAKVKDEMKEMKELKEFIELKENSDLLLDEKLDDFIETKASLGQIHEKVDFSDTNSVNSDEKDEKSVKDSSLCCEKVQELPVQVNWLGEFLKKNDEFCNEYDFSRKNESDSIDELELETLIQSFQEEIDDEFIEFEPNFDSNNEFESDSCLKNEMELEYEDLKATVFAEEGNVAIKSRGFDSDEEYEDDVFMEHQDLISQMKMELKTARTGGLPTILEECETSRMKDDDLKPLKLDEKREHRDQMAEIEKFYRSYTEKMRKLDILNYQTLQAINVLRMKHPEQLNSNENASLSAIKSVLMPSLWPCKLRKIYADPTLKSVTELHKDLEIVYVGQACLSWEILQWQYKKAKELQLYDSQGYRSYNQVVIEFQQFHVLLRRYTEDELFQGPRVLNYTKERCTLRGLLQVPAIKDDNVKEKVTKEDDEDAVTISTLAKTIKESMTVFWEFLHTDKDTTNLFLTVILQGNKANLQDPNDSDLFIDIKTIHQKKEKRLKDMLRTGNCIVKKFQKQQETILDQHMFISQVELKLVSRVLSLPRLTRDQLVWCQSKLNNIKFIDRKIQVEDSLFLLFPC